MTNKFLKIALIVLSTILFTFNTQAQVREVLEAIKPTKAFEGVPILKKGNGVFQFGVGLGTNLVSLINQTGLGNLLNTNSTNKNTGPFVVGYEYLVKDNLGIGIGFSYAESNQTISSNGTAGSIIDIILGTPSTSTTSLKTRVKNTSIIASTTYHLYTTDKLDPYTKVSIGFNIWKVSAKNQAGNDVNTAPTTPTPIAYNAVIGLRYFVTPKVGIFGEASYSNLKFAANAGLTFKIH